MYQNGRSWFNKQTYRKDTAKKAYVSMGGQY